MVYSKTPYRNYKIFMTKVCDQIEPAELFYKIKLMQAT